MKKIQKSTFKLNPIAAAIAMALASQAHMNMAQAGSGWGVGYYVTNPSQSAPVQTYYAHSPVGAVTALDSVTGLPAIDPVTNLPVMADSGMPLRKFVDTLPGIQGITSFGANNLGQIIPVAVPEKWTDAKGNKTDDYYEIAAIEFSEKMHSDLPKATHLRGYVQISTPTNPGKHIALKYPNGSPILDVNKAQVYAYDTPHHLGPVIKAASGTAVRVKFTNYLPVGGNLFLPVDKTIPGAGLGLDGKTYYTENRAEIHLVGGQAPWISAGSPHQWVAPAADTTTYKKGVSTQNVPDMVDPGAGSTTLYFPNTQSARFMFYQDHTSGLTRLNSYAGLEAGYFVTDNTEAGLVSNHVIPADQIPLIIEDKTFVPANINQQDAKWDTTHWGQPGDLWFPHVYEANQDPEAVDGLNPVGRWDYGPWFWPIFVPTTTPMPSGVYGDATLTPESYQDTPVINGTAYPTLTVDPKAYRFRILNASNDRFLNLGLYKADGTSAPQLDRNGNPMFDAKGQQLFLTNTEIKMVPASAADTSGNPMVPSSYADQNCLCQYPDLQQLQPAIQFSGPNRAWPIDSRIGGAPDPESVGPDFIAIGTDGGFLPNPVDIPSQPITYESNRRSVTVSNVYGYGLLLAPAERTDAIVDFSKYAGQTLILYNDAPAPFPFNDQRDDFFTGSPDQTSTGGTYSTKPGYGPNTRTMMQIKVNATTVADTNAFSSAVLATELPKAYAASQPAPIVPGVAYNTAFGTNDADKFAHVATGSVAQPTLDFTTSGTQTISGINLISSGGQLLVGTNNIVGNAIPGSGQNYDPLNPPTVNFVDPTPGVSCGSGAQAFATVDPVSRQVTAVTLGLRGQATIPSYSGYTCTPIVTFTNPAGTVGVGAQASVQTTTSQSVLVQTKAEQELFDTAGRYNSTAGVELPLTSGTTQTTVPLNYIDSPTESIKDGEVQIWKIVDNGFWSNSLHFDLVDVQLINRVGWDGTVKAPATNEFGWKDTVRINPLEDVIVAMRAKRSNVPFGQPASSRLQDPSVQTGAAGSGLGFTADPGVTDPSGAPLLVTTTNITANYDNEYVWSSAVLGHAENDLQRPVVFHPTVTRPAVPTGLAGTLGTLSWTDATPAGAAATLANTGNEIGFNVLRAAYAANGTLGAYATIGTVLANVTSFNDTTRTAGVDYSYQVQASNAAGNATSAGFTELTYPGTPTWATTGAVVINPANGVVTLKWNSVTNATGYVVTANGTAYPLIKAVTGNTQTTSLTLPLGVNYSSITITAQRAMYGVTANSAVSAPQTADLTFVMPAPVMSATTITAAGVPTLHWTAVTGSTGYLVSVNGGTAIAVASTATSYTFPTAPAAGSLAVGSVYNVTVVAKGSKYGQAVLSTASPASIDLTAGTAPAAPVVGATTITAAGVPTLHWTAVTGVSGYLVSVNGGTAIAVASTATSYTFPTAPATGSLAIGSVYTVTVTAQVTKYGVTVKSTAAAGSVNLAAPAVPAAPTGLTVGTLTATRAPIYWSAVSGATAYVVQVSTNGGAYSTLATVTALPTAAAPYNATIAAGNNYSYQVLAQTTLYGQVVNSATASNVVSASALPTVSTTPVLAVGVTGSKAITVTWTNTSSNITGWTVQRRLGAQGAVTVLVPTPTVTKTGTTTYSVVDSGLTAGSSYAYSVIATSAGGSSAASTFSANVIAR